MRPQELRIGNIITHCDYSDAAFVVTEIVKQDDSYVISTSGGKNGTWDNLIECVEPIPLTEEWLLKFNCKNTHGILWETPKGIRFIFYKHDGVAQFTIGPRHVDLFYAHELQNIAALTGEELVIKP